MLRVTIAVFVLSWCFVSESRHHRHKHLQLRVTEEDANYQGTFDSFLRKFLFLLWGGFDKESKALCLVFSKHLSNLNCGGPAKKLAKKFKKFATMDESDRQDDLQEYRDALQKKIPAMTEFFKAINAAFTLQQRIQFDDYLYEMENFLRGDKFSMDEETRKLLTDVILKNIMEMSKRDRKDIKKKYKNALKALESGGDEDVNIQDIIDMLNKGKVHKEGETIVIKQLL